MLLTAALIGTTTVPAASQATDWFETGGGQIRLVVAPPSQGDEVVRGVIEIELADGWHTYWRDPGSSGIPPQIDIAGSTGLLDAEIEYPAPKWVENEYGDYAGYSGSARFPVTFTRTATAPHRLTANMFLGVCEDICIPVQTQFTTEIGYARGSTLEALIVERAHDALPGEPATGFGLSDAPEPPDGRGYVKIDHASMPDELPQLFVYAPDGTQFYPPKPVETVDGQTLFEVKPIKVSATTRSIDAFITVTAGERSFTTSRALEVAGSHAENAPAD